MLKNKTSTPVLSLKNDILFKRVYGSDTEESKFILKALLNKILSRVEDPIMSIEYKNPFSIDECAYEKESILDIKAETNKRQLIDIEMQIVWDKDMPSRLLYYHGDLLRGSLQKGESYDRMKQTITICITDSTAFKTEDKFLNEFFFMEKDEHFVFSDMTKICCIELPKVNPDKRKPEELSQLEICLEYLRCADENGSEYVNELVRRGGKDLEMAQEILRKATEEEILRERALAREKFLRDKLHMESRYGHGLEEGHAKGLEEGHAKGLEEGHAKGLEEGHAKGLEEGRIEKTLEIAKNLKLSGIPVEVVAENTGLSVEEIEKL